MSSIQIYQESIDVDSFDDRELPTDIHLITFTPKDGQQQVDAVRAYTMVDIFDYYYDKMDGAGEIHSIKSGFGRIKPKLYGKIKTED